MISPRAMLAAIAALGRSVSRCQLLAKAAEMEHSLYYPEWRSKRKTRGRRDASLRNRSNRRKAQGRK